MYIIQVTYNFIQTRRSMLHYLIQMSRHITSSLPFLLCFSYMVLINFVFVSGDLMDMSIHYFCFFVDKLLLYWSPILTGTSFYQRAISTLYSNGCVYSLKQNIWREEVDEYQI